MRSCTAVAGLVLTLAPVAQSANYVFTKIADTGPGPFLDGSVGEAQVNDTGQVLVGGQNGEDAYFKYYRYEEDGSGETHIITINPDNGPYISSFAATQFNNGGAAALRVTVGGENPFSAIVTGSGGPIQTVYADSASLQLGTLAGYNDGGDVYFFARIPPNGFQSLHRGNGGPMTTMAGPAVGCYAGGLNNSGQGVYLPCNLSSVHRTDGTIDATIADNSGPYSQFSPPFSAINNMGQVMMFGELDAGGRELLVGSGGPLTTIFAEQANLVLSPTPFSINDNGDLVFGVETVTGPSAWYVVTGPSLATDVVLATGDVLDGRTVERPSIDRNALNISGQIAVTVSFSDQTTAVYLATPDGASCGGPPDGDMNGNAVTNGVDIGPFSRALLEISTQAADLCHGDFSQNSMIDPPDISGFVTALLQG